MVVAGALLFALTAGAALAAAINCGGGGAPCEGTDRGDRITGAEGRDEVSAKAGRDLVDARSGSDVVRGGRGGDLSEDGSAGLYGDSPVPGTDTSLDGDDTIFARDGRKDFVDCGGGTGSYSFDPGIDELAENCENEIANF